MNQFGYPNGFEIASEQLQFLRDKNTGVSSLECRWIFINVTDEGEIHMFMPKSGDSKPLPCEVQLAQG